MNPVWMVSSFDDEAHSSHHQVARDRSQRDRYLMEARERGLRTQLEIWSGVGNLGEVVWSVVS